VRKYSLVCLGNLTRTTVGGGESDKRFEFTNDVLHWLWSWRLQVERHAESTSNDGQGSTPVQKRRSFSKTSYDEHMLTVVGAHLMKAIQRAEAELGELLFDNEAVSALPLLRNLYEHWASRPQRERCMRRGWQMTFPHETTWIICHGF